MHHSTTLLISKYIQYNIIQTRCKECQYRFVSSSASPFYPVGTGECIRLCKEKMDARNVYLTNPAFDKIQPRG